MLDVKAMGAIRYDSELVTSQRTRIHTTTQQEALAIAGALSEMGYTVFGPWPDRMPTDTDPAPPEGWHVHFVIDRETVADTARGDRVNVDGSWERGVEVLAWT